MPKNKIIGGIKYMNIIKTQLTFAESMQFVNGVIDSVFVKDSDGNDIDYSPASLQPLIQSTFAELYTNMEFVEDFETNFAEYMTIDIEKYVEEGKVNADQYIGMIKAIEDGISFRKQQMLNNKKSASDEMFNEITTLLSTLNDKASQLDPKKLNKYLKKLNPNEIVKAYQKSNIPDGVRDKAIQELAKENKVLRNKDTARNVKVVK